MDLGASLVAQWSRTCHQCRRHRFNPWSGKIPPLVEQLSLCATATEPVSSRACGLQLWSPCSATTEAHTPGVRVLQLQSSPHLLQLGKSQSSNEDPAQPKINKQSRGKKKKIKHQSYEKKDELVHSQVFLAACDASPFFLTYALFLGKYCAVFRHCYRFTFLRIL